MTEIELVFYFFTAMMFMGIIIGTVLLMFRQSV